MAQIGSLTVDLSLKSANFIRDLGKSAQATARSTAMMQRSISTLTVSLGGLFSAKLARQIVSITDESLKLAASMHGPLADAARTFNSQFEELQDKLKLGIAAGFLTEMGGAVANSQANLEQAGKAGTVFGKALGWLSNQATTFIGIELPGFMEDTENKFNAATTAANNFRDRLWNITTVAKTVPSIVPKLSADMAAYGSELEIAAMKQESFWSTTTQLTAGGELLLNQQKAYIEFVQQAGGPLEQYRLALIGINDAQLDGAQKATLTMQATAGLANQWIGAIGQFSQAATTMFAENKGLAIANAVINTAEAITAAIKNPPGPPFSFAYAAGAAAMGAAQIATIASANPGTSSRPKAFKGGATSAPARAGAASKGGGGGQQTSIVIEMKGTSLFGPDQVRQLAAALNGAVADGTTLISTRVM